MKLAIVIPTYNEAETIPSLIKELFEKIKQLVEKLDNDLKSKDKVIKFKDLSKY
mgnify:CR=1 FL=1